MHVWYDEISQTLWEAKPMMKTKHYKEDARRTLELPAKTERHYIVPGTGRGYTLDLEIAQEWASQRARFTGKPIPVLYQDVQYSEWSVASDHIGGE
jgi:hypothetical protein